MEIVRHPTKGHVVPSPPEPCRECGRTMLGQYAFRDLPEDQRTQFTRHHAGGRCIACYRRHRGDTAGHEGRWARDDLVYEWEFLRDQGYDRRSAARRLHVSYAALCKAIERTNRSDHTQNTDREELAS